MQEKQNIPEPKLQLSTRNYTPTRTRYDSSITNSMSSSDCSKENNIYERLYRMSMTKAEIVDKFESSLKAQPAKTKKVTLTDSIVIGRLYGRSKLMQEEGKSKRESIQKKLSSKYQFKGKKKYQNTKTPPREEELSPFETERF